MYEAQIKLITDRNATRLEDLTAGKSDPQSEAARVIVDSIIGMPLGWLVLYQLYCEGETVETRCAFITNSAREMAVAWDNPTDEGAL